MISIIKKVIGNTPKQWAIFSFGLYFLVLLHYFQLNQGGSGLNHPMNPLGWIIVSVVIACALVQIARSGHFRFNYLSKNFAIACLILLIPLVYSGETGWYSHQRLLGLFAGLALLFSIQQLNFKRRDYFKVFFFIIIAAALESTLGLFQYYVLPYFPELNLNTARPSALFFQPNVAASFFVIGALLSLVALQRGPKKTALLGYFCYFCTLTCAMAIGLLQSRTGYIAAIVGSILLLSHSSAVNKKWLATVTLGILISVISINSLERFSRSSEVYGHPGLRVQIYTDSLEIIAKRPLMGHGYGSFIPTYLEHQADKLHKKNTGESYRPAYKMDHPHNEVLLWLVEGGLIGLAAMLLIFFTICRVLFRAQKQRLLLLALLFPSAFHTLTEFPFYQSVAAWMVFIIFCAFALPQTQCMTISTSKASVYHLTATLLVIITTLYMVSILISQQRVSRTAEDPQSAVILNTALPFVSDSFIELRNQQRLSISMQRGLDSEVNYYFNWAGKVNQVAPRPNRYKNQLLAALYFKKIELANKILAQAKALYPTVDWQEQEEWINQRKTEIRRTNQTANPVN